MKEFWVWNDTDGVPCSPEPLATREEAEKFCTDFRARYKGGYLTARHERIAAEDIALRIVEDDGE